MAAGVGATLAAGRGSKGLRSSLVVLLQLLRHLLPLLESLLPVPARIPCELCFEQNMLAAQGAAAPAPSA